MKKSLVKRLLTGVLVFSMIAGLTACGGGASAPASAPAPAEEKKEEAPAPAEEKTEEAAAPEGDSAASGMKIGATFYTLQTEFCMRMDNEAKKWAAENGVTYTSYDGKNDAAEQLKQVETMIADGVDAIILNPQDADACSACVDAAVEAGIPIVGVNTMVNNDKLTSYTGSQDVGAGEEIMQYMIDYMGRDDFSIVIIEGPMGQSAQLQRIEGIENVLAKNPNIKELVRNTANWSRSEAMTLMETWITTYGDQIEAVIAENDEMALGAREALNANGMDVPCIGIDGITDAVTAVSNGNMIASDFQNAEGQIRGALDTAVAAAKGESVEKEVWIPFEMITPDNYQEYVGRY